MTPAQAAEAIVNKLEMDAADAWYPRTFYDDAMTYIEQAISATVREKEARIVELEKENTILRARLEFLSPTVRAGLND